MTQEPEFGDQGDEPEVTLPEGYEDMDFDDRVRDSRDEAVAKPAEEKVKVVAAVEEAPAVEAETPAVVAETPTEEAETTAVEAEAPAKATAEDTAKA